MRTATFIFAPFIFVALVAACVEKSPSAPVGGRGEITVLVREAAAPEGQEERYGKSGFDHDLVRRLAEELGVAPRIVVAQSDGELLQRLKNGEALLAAAWQSPVADAGIRKSAPYAESANVLVAHEASLPLTRIEQLAGRTVAVVAGSRQEAALREIGLRVSGLRIAAQKKLKVLDLMEGVARRRFDLALVDSVDYDIGSNFYPELEESLHPGADEPVVLLFAPQAGEELIAKVDAALSRLQKNGEMARLRDRYFGHIERLAANDSGHFIDGIRTVLPLYRTQFERAEADTGIDWRVLAALAYQESHWKPLATSPTGVRGMMMLTEETADALGVNNRLDPAQSIRAGARYLADLRNALPPSVREPDRLWLALAAYNLGMGHLRVARALAKERKLNPDSWFEMKKALPLLAKPEIYRRLKSGKGRGGEAVIMVENIRLFVDILNRHEPPKRSIERAFDAADEGTRTPAWLGRATDDMALMPF